MAGYRAGIPERWGSAERDGATAAFAVMREYGGDQFTGGLPSLDPKTFWPGSDF